VIATALLSALVLVPAAVMAQSSTATHFKVIHTFNNLKQGAQSSTSPIRDKAGNLYGTTEAGGDLSCECGVVFKIDPSGHESVLHKFTGEDGATPIAILALDAAGNLYGATQLGGKNGNNGNVFKVAADGHFTVLYAFKGGTDGTNPWHGSMVVDKAGNVYGTAHNVYKVTPGGHETVLHNFTASEGINPIGVVQDAAGNFYGAGNEGGAYGLGTVWKLAKNGTLTVLHSFAGGSTDGAYPNNGVIVDKQGNVYGNATGGGAAGCPTLIIGCGVVYKVSPSGEETILHFFTPDGVDGFWPTDEPALDNSGSLYGTTLYGGNYVEYPCDGLGCGVVFKIDPSGKTETILHGFTGGKDGGVFLNAGVVLDANENVYGNTSEFGNFGLGTIFKITQ